MAIWTRLLQGGISGRVSSRRCFTTKTSAGAKPFEGVGAIAREKLKGVYEPEHKILLIGEGDFGFGNCLAKTFGDAKGMTATSFNSYEELLRMYTKAAAHIEGIKELNGTIEFNVDATSIAKDPRFMEKKFDRILYNMPHSGFRKGLYENSNKLISYHRELVGGYFQNSFELVNEEKGEVHLTHHTHPPYNRWKVVELAQEAGLYLKEQCPFNPSEYPTYTPKRGSGRTPDQTFPLDCNTCSLYRFCRSPGV